jgi:beta-glucosidase
MKWKLGLFENPYTEVGGEKFCLPSSLEASREAAVESAVLLKNDGMLPLQCKGRIAVVGPLADAPVEQLGTWCGRADEDAPVSAVEAVRAECAGKASVVFESGLTFSRDRSEKGIAKAVRAAESADVVLFFAGEERILSGEARCRADITLPGAQKDMMKALKKVGKPIVLVVMAGRPLAVAEEIEMADAVIYAFHGGTMAGPALSDLIFGKAVPSGRLPVCLPRMAGQIPVYYNHKNTGRPAHNVVMLDDIPIGAKQSTLGHTSYYLDAGDGPLYTFGYGLSYTTFEYGPVTLSASEIRPGDTLKASCEVRNTGNADAYETVQLYVRDDVGSMTRPVRELKGFSKILIPAGESRKVEFTLTSEDLKYWNIGQGFIAEPGTFTLWIAPDSASGTGVNFELI